MTLDLLCKVVDNYGDIGVVYRLARALSELQDPPELRLTVSDLKAFQNLEPMVDPSKAVQHVRGWTVLSWSGPDALSLTEYDQVFRDVPPVVVIECFACGRPDWFESMLFDESRLSIRTIVNLEFLSAEEYAEEFHLIPSITRSSYVKKHMFMPGFTAKTGGLILDDHFINAMSRQRITRSLRVLVFSYERDYTGIVQELADFNLKHPVEAVVANGKSETCFIDSWERAGQPFPALRLPFLPQTEWDKMLVSCDFLIVRGEDSMARAALSGKPFLWHAYPQDLSHHMVKVKALMERMRPFFDAAQFNQVSSAFMAFNDRPADGADVVGKEKILPLLELAVRQSAGSSPDGFCRFASSLLENGNLAANLMTFLRKVV